MATSLIAPLITTAGLICDMIGAILVAIEVVKVFNGPTTIDIGGLGFLLFGFSLQILAAWWPVICKCRLITVRSRYSPSASP